MKTGIEIAVALLVAIVSILFRTWLIQICWEAVVPAVLPGLVASGAVAGTIGFWKALLAWSLVDLLTQKSSAEKKEAA